jgi:glucosamine-6-phosphate deaminase
MEIAGPCPPFRAGHISVSVHTTRGALGTACASAGAAYIAQVQRSRPGPVRIVFAAAPSQLETLAALATDKNIDWSRVHCFHMDEYIGGSLFSDFLFEHIWNGVRPGVIHKLDGRAAVKDSDAECARYGALFSAAPIDVCFAGIGENGHLAFNDPPVADFADPSIVKCVALDAACRAQQVNDGCFPTLADVPTHALTLSIPALMSAAAVFVAVPGPTKRAAVTATLVGEAAAAVCPATALRSHNAATLFIDVESWDAGAVLAALPEAVAAAATYASDGAGSRRVRGLHYRTGAPIELALDPVSGLIARVDALGAEQAGEGASGHALPWIGPGLVDLQVRLPTHSRTHIVRESPFVSNAPRSMAGRAWTSTAAAPRPKATVAEVQRAWLLASGPSASPPSARPSSPLRWPALRRRYGG